MGSTPAPASKASVGSTGDSQLVGVSDQELQALLSQKDIATSLAEDLLKHFGSPGPGDDLEIKEESQSNTGT